MTDMMSVMAQSDSMNNCCHGCSASKLFSFLSALCELYDKP